MINIQLRILESPISGLSSIHPHLTIGYIIFYTVIVLGAGGIGLRLLY